MCYWKGVECDSDTETIVDTLFLPEFNVTSRILPCLGELKSLREISLPQNRGFGTIPSEVSNFPNLEAVCPSFNNLSGSIPKWASPSLLRLDL